MTLHPVLEAAADGIVPTWSRVGPARLEHMRRVARLLGEWATAEGAGEDLARRWRAAGILHDSLREANPEEIRHLLPIELSDLPANVVHGPAAAARLEREGVVDEAFLRAVAYHTIGHPDFDPLGLALYAADFLEPGRVPLAEWRAELRARMTESPQTVVREVARVRVGQLLDEFSPIRWETHAFWNVLTSPSRG